MSEPVQANQSTRGARGIKRWDGFSATNTMEARLHRLNSQTPCPPRGAVPVNQERYWRLFHSNGQFEFGHGCDHPSYVSRVWHHVQNVPRISFVCLSGQRRSHRNDRGRYVPKIATISRICRLFGRARPFFQAFTIDVAIPILAAK
jgi:hypothetical protein